MNSTNGELELISEGDYRMDVYPCYTYEYHIESKELFDPNGDRIDDDYSKIFGKYTDEMKSSKRDFEYRFFHPSDTID